MLPPDRLPSHDEILGPPPTPVQMYRGTVGWDEHDEHADLGVVDTTAGAGRTLIRVTLFAGRDPSTPPRQGLADGLRVLVQPNAWPVLAIPPRGSGCLVCFPEGDFSPGAGMLCGVYADTAGTSQFRADRVVIDVGPDIDLVIKGRSVTITDCYAGPGRFLTVGAPPTGGPAGIVFIDEKGAGATVQSGAVALFATDGASPPDAKSLVQLTTSGIELLQKDGSFIKLKGGAISGMGTTVQWRGTCFLGSNPTNVNPVLWGASPGPGAPSDSVFVSPTP